MALINVKPTALDIRLANAIARRTNRGAERVAGVVTWGADEKLLFAAAALGWLCSRQASPDARRLSDHVFAVTVAAAILPHVVKSVVDQERPDRRTVRGHWRGIPRSGEKYDAFPSGHAAHVGALMSAATLLPPPWRSASWLLGTVLVSTRIILLAHWFSDVVAGLAIGAALERLLRLVTRPPAVVARPETQRKPGATRGSRARLKTS